jgi:hypothetical protein
VAENFGRKSGAGLAAIALFGGREMQKHSRAASAIRVAGLAMAVGLAMIFTASGGAEAAAKAKAKPRNCKTLVGEMVSFGEDSTRSGANEALDREIAAWETKYSVKAKPQDRQMACKDYIKFLNEYECKVTAVVCR